MTEEEGGKQEENELNGLGYAHPIRLSIARLDTNSLEGEDLGLFVFLVSRPKGWQFSVEKIAKAVKWGRDKTQKRLRRLEEFGLLERKHGFQEYFYILNEQIK